MRRIRLFKFWKMCLALIMLSIYSISLPAQERTISGRVVDEKGVPLAGTGISAKSSGVSTSADAEGRFTIRIQSGDKSLTVTFIGYQTKEVAINAQTRTLNISLQPEETSLNEVVVIGYGTQRRRDVTGSVASVSEATLKEVPAPNLISQLKGRTAGVDIVSNSSAPGAGGAIRIRGNRTITNSQGSSDALDGPLLVLDGVPYGGSINDFSPDDIANIDILKDASATAIYGSRGAGGVILITTKRGRAGRTIVSYDGYYGTSNVLNKYQLFNGTEYAQFKADAATYNRSNPGLTSYLLTQAEKDALDAGISTDWQDLIYRSGMTNNQQVTISGGAEATQFSVAANYFNESGIIPNQKYDRGTLRATIDQTINKYIKVGLNTINTLSYNNNPGGSNVPFTLARLTPLAAPYQADGKVNLNPAVGSIDANLVSPLTLITQQDQILSRTRRIRTFNSLYGEVNITDGLRYRLNVGLDFRQENGNGYNPPNTFVNTGTTQVQSRASISNAEAWSYNFQHLLYFDKMFAGKHKLNVTGLFEINKEHNKSNGFTITGVPADYIKNSNFGLASANPVSNPDVTSFWQRGLVSYMGRINYGFDDRYLLTGTVRVDGSSTLSPGFQYFTYPAFGAGWNISNERFMKSISFVSNLKLRGGWGVSGNRNVEPYSTLGLLSASAYNFGQGSAGQQLAYYVSSLPNSNLTWQSTSQWDVGLDFSVLNNRISGTVDAYQQKTKDILLSVPLPASTGANSTFQNLGRTEGRGIEATLSTINVRSKGGFSWSTDFTYYFNREKITYLTSPTDMMNIGAGWFVGQPLSVIYDVKKIGIWQTSDAQDGTLAKQTSPVQFPGQIRVQDLDGNGKIDANDRQILGNFQPQWQGGFTSRFNYKNFDLSVVTYARMGMKVMVPYLSADGGANGFPFFNQGRLNQIKINYWTTENPTHDFPAPDAGTDRLNFGSTLAYRDGSFIKCRSINLGYAVPSKVFGKKAESTTVRVYLNVTNPFIIYSPLVKSGLAIDPEGNGYGGSVSAFGGSDVAVPNRQISVNLNNPSLRQFVFGVNAKF